MKLYVASSFSFIDIVKEVVKELEKEGHKITVKWYDREYNVNGINIKTTVLKEKFKNMNSKEFYKRPETKLSYFADLQGIEEADAFVLVAPDEASRDNFIGANVELGYALCLEINCYSLGELMNSALYYDVIKCVNIEHLLKLLNELENEIYDLV